MMELFNDVYKSAELGYSSNLKILLSLFESKAKERSQLLEHKTKDADQIATPLIIASLNGHVNCVKIILSYDANLEARGTVKIDDNIVEETSALWAASAKGEMDIVKLLIKKGANVNSRTKTNSTPLRATAYGGRIDIVSYLVEHGAGVNVMNIFEHTPLMVACYKGHQHVVNYLIEKGAKIDAQDKKGNTVLHEAAEAGHLDIVKYLVSKGASELPNNLGLTPLLLACNHCQTEIVEYLIARPVCSKLEEIQSLELLGATIANSSDPDAYHVEKSYEFMMRGMKRRYEGDKCVEKKDVLPPIKAYQNRVECQTEEQLKEIQNDPHAVHTEGLVVRERILGRNNTELYFPIRYRGAVFADSANFQLCISLWKYAVDIHQQNDLAVADDLKMFGDLFRQMIQRKVFPSFCDVLDVLEHAVLEYEKVNQKIHKADENKLKILKDDLESVMHRSLYFLTIFEQLKLTETEEKSLQILLYKYLCMNPRTKQGKTLVHLAVSGVATTDKHCNPCHKTTKLLLQTGAQANTVDNDGNTPLHTVVMTRPTQEQQETVEKIISSLFEAGVHEDVTNSSGKTAVDISATEKLKQFLVLKRKIVLKCLAARSIKRYKLHFTGLVPKSMEIFINAH